MADQPLYDPLLEAFAVKVSTGVTPSHAYHQVYFPDKPLSKQSAWEGGKKRMALAVIKERVRQLSAQITRFPDRQPDQPTISQAQSQAVKAQSQAKDIKPPVLIDDGQPDNPRQALLRRLWQAVNSDTNPEAIAAVKALRDWLREDEQDSKAQQVADPAIIAKHCASIAREYADMTPAVQLQYAERVLNLVASCGIPLDDMRLVLIRADDPPIRQPLDSIDPNSPTPTDAPLITEPVVIV